MKVFVTGASGQVGHDICALLQERGVDHKGTSSQNLDIRDPEAVARELIQYAPDVVVHCAAWTQVDLAQEHTAEVMAINVQGTQHIAAICRRLGCKLVYLSTDYVFSGEKDGAYQTDDVPDPLNVYGQSKLGGERAVTEGLSRYFIVRTSWAFGAHGTNFVESMLKLSKTKHEIAVVCDQIGSPTYTKDLAQIICDMMVTEQYGIYHITNEGDCSWAQFAEEIFRQSRLPVRVLTIRAAEYGAKAPRPQNSVLEKSDLDRAGFPRLPTWQDALNRYLTDREKRSSAL